jgi:hypothetical protein
MSSWYLLYFQIMTSTETVKNPLTNSNQIKWLIRYVAGVIVPVSVVFALLYPTFQQYIVSYGSAEATHSEIRPILVWVSLIFFTVWVPPIIAVIVKCMYRRGLTKLPTAQVLGILLLSSSIVAVVAWCVLEAISDPLGWGLISAIFVIPFAALLSVSLLFVAVGIGKNLQKRYESSVFMVMPLISLLLVLAVVLVQQNFYAQVQSIYEHNSKIEYEKATSQ